MTQTEPRQVELSEEELELDPSAEGVSPSPVETSGNTVTSQDPDASEVRDAP